MKCPICNLTIKKLLSGGFCPNPNCTNKGKRTKLHKLSKRYITQEDKANIDKLIDRFQRNVTMVHNLNMTFQKSQRMKEYISAYHLMDKTVAFLQGLEQPGYTDRIDWYDFVVDVIDWVFTESGDFAKKLTSLTNLDGQLFQRAAPHVYVSHRSRLAQEDNDLLVISRSSENGIALRSTLF